MVEPNGSAAEPQTDDSRATRMGLLAYPRVIDALDDAAALETLAASPLSRVRSRRGVRLRLRQRLASGLGSDLRDNAFQRLWYPAKRTAFGP